jgi:hypothetical protein
VHPSDHRNFYKRAEPQEIRMPKECVGEQSKEEEKNRNISIRIHSIECQCCRRE